MGFGSRPMGGKVISVEMVKDQRSWRGDFMDSEVSRPRREGKTKPGAKLSMNGGG